MYERKLITSKTHPKFETLDQFMIYSPKANIQTNRQTTLNCQMATIITMVLPGKQNLSNEKNGMGNLNMGILV